MTAFTTASARGASPLAADLGRVAFLESILAGAADGIFVFDREFRCAYVNASAAALFGQHPEDLVGRRWEEAHPAELTSGWRALANQVFENRATVRDEAPFTTGRGVRIYEYVLTPVPAEAGDVELVVSVVRDVTERRRAEEALAIAVAAEHRARARGTKLHDVVAALSRATTRDDVGAVIVNEAFAALEAQSAVAYFIHDDGRLVIGAARGLTEEALAPMRVLPRDAPLPLAQAIVEGVPIWLESLEALLSRYPGLRNAKTPSAKLQAVAAIPLCSDARAVGGVAFSFGSPRKFDDDERTFLLTLANHAALAAERCQLRQEEATARTRLTILAGASRRFSEAKLELRDTLDTIAREVAARLRDSCAINLLSADEKVLEPVAIANVDPEAEAATRKTMAAAPVRIDQGSSLARVVTTGEPLLVPAVPIEAWIANSPRPEYADYHRRFPTTTLLVVPLQARGKRIGTITVSRGAEGPPYTHADQVLLQDLADRAGLAIANARQYEELGWERRRLAVLAKASEVFATSLDYETTLRNVIELALPTLGDFGFFDVLEPNGQVRRVARAHQDRDRQALLDRTSFVRSERQDKILCALSTGRSGFHPDVDSAWLTDVATSPEHLALMEKLAFGSMITVPLISQSNALGALTLFFANTNRRHTESDLRLAEELARRAAAAVENAQLFRQSREAIAVRDDFLSIAGHELNTPLAALQLQIQSLKRLAQKTQAPDRFCERLAKTEGHIARLEKLVRELLDVSRITAGRLRIDPEPMDITLTIKEVTERLAPHAASAGCDLVCEGNESIVGSWDRLRIEQVLTNLIGNSIKYGAGHPIEVGVRREDAVARIAVRDFGVGISPQDEERIFGRFERAVSQRHYGGLGLGLWIARQIVQAHGGTIRFDRPPDVGSRFIVELPLEPSE